MKKLFGIMLMSLIVVFAKHTVFAQGIPGPQPIIKKMMRASYVCSDLLGNFYVVSGQTLLMYNSDGDLQFSYDEKSYGNISFIDVSDPMKILVWYSDMSQLVFLDNTLSRKWPVVELYRLGLSQAGPFCRSYNSGFWTYDPVTHQLIRYDQNLKPEQESGDLSLLVDEKLDPEFLLEYDNQVYMSDTALGILVFDRYGGYLKKYPVKGVSRFQLLDDKLIYYKENQLYYFDMKTMEERQKILPVSRPVMVEWRIGRVYVLMPEAVLVYAF